MRKENKTNKWGIILLPRKQRLIVPSKERKKRLRRWKLVKKCI
jgi:hypothetical protein